MLSGQYFVAFVGTLPFLVLGVGIDDMFIILDGMYSINYCLDIFVTFRIVQNILLFKFS